MSRRIDGWAVAGLLVVMLGLSGCRPTAAQRPDQPVPAAAVDTAPMVAPQPASGALGALETSLAGVYEKLNKSVVNINVVADMARRGVVPELDEEGAGSPAIPPALRDYIPEGIWPGPGRGRVPRDMPPPRRFGSGSGFVWDTKGHIVTNNHVVGGASRITVTFADGTQVTATPVGADPDSDLAVVKVDLPADQLFPVTLADSTQVKPGALSIALGNPFGLDGSMTVGFISAVGRVVPTDPEAGPDARYTIPDVLQTDAPINPGNSGGVLADGQGNVIGVPTQIVSSVGTSAGIGFAVPSAIVSKVVPALISTGRYEHAYLGIKGGSLVPELAKAMKLPENTRGALVGEIMPDSPSDKAGLRGSDRETEIDGEKVNVGGDVIIALEDQPLRSFDDLVTELARHGVIGQPLKLTILRDGKQQDVTVDLAARPSNTPASAPATPDAEPVLGPAGGMTLGIAGLDLTADLAEAAGLPKDLKGILVTAIEAGSPADKAGFRGGDRSADADLLKRLPEGPDAAAQLQAVRLGGDVITAFNGEPVTTLAELRAKLAKVTVGSTVKVTVLRAGEKMDLEVVFPNT